MRFSVFSSLLTLYLYKCFEHIDCDEFISQKTHKSTKKLQQKNLILKLKHIIAVVSNVKINCHYFCR